MSSAVPRAAIVTVSSSRASEGGPADVSGEELADFARAVGAEVVAREAVADHRRAIEQLIGRLCDEEGCDLVLTTGGTGFAPDDVTPEATLAAGEREAPGIAEAMRIASREHTPHWMLARNRAVIRGHALIVNFPGSPKAIGEAGAAIADALPHALRLLAGERDSHGHR